MNVYFLDRHPVKVAEFYVDRHVLTMIAEIGWILSSAHRLLDGKLQKQVMAPAIYRNLCTMGWTGRVDQTALLLPGESLVFKAEMFEKVSDISGWSIQDSRAVPIIGERGFLIDHLHPCTHWVCERVQNYAWLSELFKALYDEKIFRFPDSHDDTMDLYGEFLSKVPVHLVDNSGFTDPPILMPASYKVDDPVESYRRYYIGDKYHFAKWTRRSIPRWYLESLAEVWAFDPDTRIKKISDPKIAKKTQITLKHVKKYLPHVYKRLVIC